MSAVGRARAALCGPIQEAALALEKELLPSNTPSPFSPAYANQTANQTTTTSSLGNRLEVGIGPDTGHVRVILWPWPVNKPVSCLSTCHFYDTAQRKALPHVLAHQVSAAHDCMARAGRHHHLCLKDEETEA